MHKARTKVPWNWFNSGKKENAKALCGSIGKTKRIEGFGTNDKAVIYVTPRRFEKKKPKQTQKHNKENPNTNIITKAVYFIGN